MSDQSKEGKGEYLTAGQLAELLQVSESTIHRLRRAGRIPAVLITGRLIRFNLRDVKLALKAFSETARPAAGREGSADDPNPHLPFEEAGEASRN